MNKPSERIVVFVTPAQKRAISATADGLGISVSELMRRAVIAFSATEEQVKAASIVDRLNAPRQPDALAQVLRKAARPLRESRESPLLAAAAAAALAREAEDAGPVAVPLEVDAVQANVEAEPARETVLVADGSADGSADGIDGTGSQPASVQPARQAAETQPAALPARARGLGNAAREIAQAVARLTGQASAADTAFAAAGAGAEIEAGAGARPANARADTPFASLGALPFARTDRPYVDASTDGDCHDEAPEGGKFA